MERYFISLALLLASVYAAERIAGGDPVEIAAYPFAVSMITNRGSGVEYTHACGGSIVTVNAVLSAASCFFTNGTADESAWWRARVGSTFSNRGGTVHLIRRITAHPAFQPDTRTNDIAVLRTTINFALTPNTVQIANIVGGAFNLANNQQIWAIGWGATRENGEISEELRSVQFWVVDQQSCANRYSELGFTVTSEMVCTGWLDVGVLGQCQGDSGSPLVIDGVVVGVHSWAEGCADGWYPGINTRVSSFTRWIVDTALAA